MTGRPRGKGDPPEGDPPGGDRPQGHPPGVSHRATDVDEARTFLARARIARLATAGADGRPHLVPIVFAYQPPFLYTGLDEKPKRVGHRALRRVRNLVENPRVAVLVDRYAENWARLGFVLLQGMAELVEEGEGLERGQALLREKYPQYRQLGLGPVIRVREERLVSWGDLALAPAGELWEAIRERRSVRRYRPEPVARPVIDQLLEVARWAPSAHNAQPWRFVILESPASRQTLSRAMGEEWRRRLERDGLPPEEIEGLLARSHARITEAPAALLVCTSVVGMDEYPDPRRRHAEWAMATQSTALAVGQLLLAAHQLGLGACWLCAPLFCPEVAGPALALPADWEAQALITLGYPAAVKERGRDPLEGRVLVR